jgi:hypothetical protein
MEVSEEFRKNAPQCFTLAHETRSPESYAHWLDLACLWFDLARHAEAMPSPANGTLAGALAGFPQKAFSLGVSLDSR